MKKIFCILLLIFLNSEFTKGLLNDQEKACFADFFFHRGIDLTLHGEKFVLMKSTLRESGWSESFLEIDDWVREIRHCIQIQMKSPRRITWVIRKWRRILVEKFKELMNEPMEFLQFTDKLQHRFHNAQCLLDLMILEGHYKLDVTDLKRYYYPKWATSLFRELRDGKFAVSEEGANFMRSCIWKELDVFVIENIKEGDENYLILLKNSELNGLKYKMINIRSMYSTKLLEKIVKEIECFSRTLIEHYKLGTEFFGWSNNPRRRIMLVELENFYENKSKIYSIENPLVFNKLNECFQTYRKNVFVRNDPGKGDFVDVNLFGEFCSNRMVVDNELNEQLDKESDCLVKHFAQKTNFKFLKALVGWRQNLYAPNVVNTARTMLKNYIFNDSYIVRLELPDGPNSKELTDSTYFEDSEEFKELKECGVLPTIDESGKEIIEAGKRLVKFNQNQWLVNAKDLEAMGWSMMKAILKPVKIDDAKEKCPICKEEYLENPSLTTVELPCKHIYHEGCIKTWIELHLTCPICKRKYEANTQKCDIQTMYREIIHVYN